MSGENVRGNILDKKISRRNAVGTAAKVAGSAIAGLVIGGVAGYVLKPEAPPVEKTVTTTVKPKGKFTEAPPPGAEVVIIHGFDAAYPPFTEVTPTGEAQGFDVDVIKWIANKYGWKVVPKPWDWSTIVTALVEGDIDIIASGMTHTAARAEKVWYSIPYYVYYHHLLTLKDEARSMEELLNSGEYIACQLGATSDEWAERLIKQGYRFKKLALDSYALALEAVLDRRAVAVISDSAFTGPYFKEKPDVAAKFREVGRLGGISTYAVATRPEDYWLRNMINHALRELMDSPLWNQLLDKWRLA
ncbi:MAG: ABC transporter substrate-binding protein [Nitrososphaerota archaeon]